MKIFSIKDKKIGFNDIYVRPNEGAAVRDFGNACQKEDTPMAQFPEDFELWIIGEWNSGTGKIEVEEPVCIATAKQYSKNKEEKK
jgi:hypothetical protein